MDYFDLAADYQGDRGERVPRDAGRGSCWCRSPPTGCSRRRRAASIARALNRAGANVSFVEIPSDKGHDAFLLDEPDFHRTLAGFLAGCAVHAGLPG